VSRVGVEYPQRRSLAEARCVQGICRVYTGRVRCVPGVHAESVRKECGVRV
jgi:hypothetical protein